MQLFRCCTGSTPHISGAIEFRKSSKLRDDGGRLLDRYIIVEPFSDLGLIGPCSLPARGVGSLSISTTQRAVYRPPLAPHSLFSIMFHLYMYIYIYTYFRWCWFMLVSSKPAVSAWEAPDLNNACAPTNPIRAFRP